MLDRKRKPVMSLSLYLGSLFLIGPNLTLGQANGPKEDAVAQTPLHVFLLIGGINMEGRGEIEQSDRKAVEDTLIWDPQ
jgi:hypothetical protein